MGLESMAIKFVTIFSGSGTSVWKSSLTTAIVEISCISFGGAGWPPESVPKNSSQLRAKSDIYTRDKISNE